MFRGKVSQFQKLKGNPLGFSNIHSVAKHQKIEGRKKSTKSLEMLKTTEKVSSGIECYAEKGNNFYISVPCAKWSNLATYNFVKFCRTLLVSSCGLKKVTIIVSFFFMQRRLKIIAFSIYNEALKSLFVWKDASRWKRTDVEHFRTSGFLDLNQWYTFAYRYWKNNGFVKGRPNKPGTAQVGVPFQVQRE